MAKKEHEGSNHSEEPVAHVHDASMSMALMHKEQAHESSVKMEEKVESPKEEPSKKMENH